VDSKPSDWVIKDEESAATCSADGECEFSVVFVRSFATGDEAQDITIEKGEERQYALTGFYKALGQDNRVTHIGQSQEMFILTGAVSYVAASALLTASAFLALASF